MLKMDPKMYDAIPLSRRLKNIINVEEETLILEKIWRDLFKLGGLKD
tara:strand:+ start:199 stop:339 length:141 start_codon:yes stop_codon:yes gene_type:complete